MTEPERIQLDALSAEVRALRSSVEKLSTQFEFVVKQGDDHEQRIRGVERWKLSIPISILLVIATIVGAALQGRL